jgi:peptidoglycan-associated lipoprotein
LGEIALKKDKMKLNRLIEPLVLALVLSVGTLGCKTNPYGVTKLPKDGDSQSAHNAKDLPPGADAKSGDSSGSQATGIAESNNHQDWIQDREALAANTVHFDYDKSAVRASETKNVAAVADYLKANPAKAVLVEGHCDERGTDEYNRALGVRRAGAIRDELVRLGIDPGRVDTISFGRDKPVDTSKTEAARARNRRGEFVVLTSPK